MQPDSYRLAVTLYVVTAAAPSDGGSVATAARSYLPGVSVAALTRMANIAAAVLVTG
jgi:hypothetical protein